MVRVEDARPCPNCASAVLPISICNTCGEVATRSDLQEVDRRLACRECRAENLTLFVCNKCGNRYLFEEVAGPAPQRFACPLCGTFVEPAATSCPACGTVFTDDAAPRPKKPPARTVRRARGEYSDLDLADIARIPGVGRARAEVLCRAGYNTLWKVKRASDDELARIPEFGTAGARTVKGSLRFILLLPRRKTKEAILEEECLCPLCGCITSLFALECLECGLRFDEEELDDELRSEVEGEQERGLLAFYDVRLEEGPNDPDLWFARALLLFDIGEFREAMRSIDVALQLDPASRRSVLARARILGAIGLEEDAAVSLRVTLAALLREGEHLVLVDEEERKVSEALESLDVLAQRECPTCGEAVFPGTQVCPACGQALVAPKPPAEAEPAPSSDFDALHELQKVMESVSPPEPSPGAEEGEILDEELGIAEAGPEPEREAEPARRAPPALTAPARVTTAIPEMAARRGLINGHGLINGRGRVNGLINGTGFINGSALTEVPLPQRPLVVRYAVVATSLLMAFVVAASLLAPPPPPAAVVVDGSVGDWAGVPTYSDPVPASDPNVAIQGYGLLLEGRRLFVLVQVAGRALGDPAGYDGFYVFLDADGSPATGYSVGGLGADYLAEVVGGSGRVASATLIEFPSDAELNWSRRAGVGSVRAAVSGPTLELSIETDDMWTFSPTVTTVLVVADDFDGVTARSSAAVTPAYGAIRVRQVPLAGVLPSGTTQALRLDVTVVGQIPAGDTWSVGPFSFAATTGLTVVPSASQITLTRATTAASVTVSVTAAGFPRGAPLTVALLAATSPRPVTIVGGGLEAYFESAPQGIRVDGLFADWVPVQVPDTDGTPVPRPSLDMSVYGGTANASGTFFMLRVAGVLGEGAPVPQRIVPSPPGGSGGGGPAMAPPPRITGEDAARVYVDANATDAAGFPVGGILADYLVEVRGANGRITRQSAFRWQSGWVPEPALGLQAAKNATSLEGSLSLDPALLNGTRMVFETDDWSGQGDATTVLVTRSAAGRGTRSEGGFELRGNPEGAQSLLAPPLTGVLGMDGSCDDAGYADAGVSAQPNMTIKAGTQSGYLWLCITAGWDDTSGSGDYATVHFDRDDSGEPGPTGGDRRFRLDAGTSTLTPYRGDDAGTDWAACTTADPPGATECHSGNAGAGAFGSREAYEFKVHYLDVWNTTTPGPGQRVGFAVLVYDSNNGTFYRWGSTTVEVDTVNLDTWGHLDIPEFPGVVLPVAAVVLLLVLRRRRRQVT